MASYLVREPRRPLEYLGAAVAWCGIGVCNTNSTAEAEGNRGGGGKLVRDSSLVRLVGSCRRERWARGIVVLSGASCLFCRQMGGLNDLCPGVQELGKFRALCNGWSKNWSVCMI